MEEPLEIRIGGRPVAVTMQTGPTRSALGFCSQRASSPSGGFRTISPPTRWTWTHPASILSGCSGASTPRLPVASAGRRDRGDRGPRVAGHEAICASAASSCPCFPTACVRRSARSPPGGLHATGLFTADGALECVREDVGRHNAMDKVVGWASVRGCSAREPASLRQRAAFLRARAEGVRRRLPDSRRRRTPSSLAVELAEDRRMTLCGFVREGRVTVYSQPWRID